MIKKEYFSIRYRGASYVSWLLKSTEKFENFDIILLSFQIMVL